MAEEPFEKRVAEANRIRAKYPDRIPVICERAARSSLPNIEKKKFLVPGTMLAGEFKYIVHKHLSQGGTRLSADQTIYLFVGSTSPKTGALMSEVYEKYKSEDGFLFITYSAENTLGSSLREESTDGAKFSSGGVACEAS
uniref:Autophagy-related protein n=1 Tax=Noctiluca scintillans TaxID=2966 RepID=A0A7S1AZX7_NOCSC|mmetsp:Transcript_69/g.200  ORF Transcript_69/g.200 Transcript_69/m.200 type:complete len:140 (+) Transcript_69:71-490(+)|eukprot:CAMPEP_0194540270 /NCGR_PEP_ID=MMETSP0253-20130528/80443_1 /TAXON_ID=2966 /ORGANISM="Noctiluca scintillans" /LENGTH=139 /DNA_ID=CAMNT_0039386625 /DNA_START=48 /DNA_END=467 /DNA_ORIENTATION=+